jgi:hypothetical protein
MLKIGDWRKLGAQPTAEEIAKSRNVMARMFSAAPLFKIFGEAGVARARQTDDAAIALIIQDAPTSQIDV